MENKDYLNENFDAKSLKVSQLRGILHEHEIDFPSNAKKSLLIQIFDNQLKPNAKKILLNHQLSLENQNDRGFINVARSTNPQSHEMSSSSDDDVQMLPASSSHGTSSTKPTKSANKSTTKTNSKPITKPKNSKSSTKSKQKDIEASDHSIIVNDDSDTPFTNDNVFQSGDSSAVDVDIEVSEKKKKKRPLGQDDLSRPSTSTEQPKKKKQTKSLSTKGNVFGVASDSEDEFFKEKILSRSKSTTPSVVAKESTKEPASHRVISAYEALHNPSLMAQASPPKEKTTPVKSAPIKTTPAKTTPVKTTSVKSTPKKESSTPKKSPKSDRTTPAKSSTVQSETKDFDEGLKKLKNSQPPSAKKKKSAASTPKEKKSTPKSSNQPTPRSRQKINQDLAAQLGITIQGLPQEDTQLSLQPKPRLVSSQTKKSAHPDSDSDSDSDPENEQEPTPSKTKINSKPAFSIGKLFKGLGFIVLWAALIAIGLLGYWYREQQYLIGYCGQEIDKVTIPRSADTPELLSDLGEYLDTHFKPSCVKCPAHARCFSHLEIGCYEDFVEYKPWYFDYLPIINRTTKFCIPDTKKAEKLEIMIDVALDLLRSKNADRNCGKTPEDDLDAGLAFDELHDLLLQMKAPYITEQEFEELWQRSIVELQKEPEIITGYTNHNILASNETNHTHATQENQNQVLRSTSLSNISFKCQLSNTLVGSLVQYKESLFVLIAVAFVAFVARFKYLSYKLEVAKTDHLYNEVLKKLQKQAKLSRASTEVPSYIGSIQLRDLVLADEYNLNRKLEVWKKISSRVEHNTNVKYQSIENYGEIMKVWEWISELES